ncbi:MAG: 2-C-methyl-D-erythritol 2,4-cyclodiphosphate synthase [Clostridia bacterium]|nr:2-C-methyl-D-erythritol 2,4-cyclodiphosphate synthase [Clostridia bacterium]
MRVAAIIAAGGESTRFGGNKLLTALPDGSAVLQKTLLAFLQCSCIDEIVVVGNEEIFRFASQFAGNKKPLLFAPKGESRGASVYSGLCATQADIVLIHDGARPFVSTGLIARVYEATAANGAAIPVLPVTDTVRDIENGTLRRDRLRLVQTPQGFYRLPLLQAYEKCAFGFTDDASVYENYTGKRVATVDGETANIKITYTSDIPTCAPRVGMGYDVHRLTENRRLVLLGVTVPHSLGLDGHSDADAPLHALMDAMLSAAGLPDIGYYFPPDDEAFRGANSLDLTKRVYQLITEKGYAVSNASIVIMAQRPKLKPYLDEMKKRTAEAIGISPSALGISVTTTEHLGFVGREEGIAAQAIVTLIQKA